jgi:hypothetical protein
MSQRKTYPEGHWMGIGMGLGIVICMPLGLIMGIVMDNIPIGIAIGPALGVGMGVGIGAGLEARHKDRVRPLTEKEKRIRKIAVLIALAFLVIGVLFFTYTLLSR